MRYSLKPDYKLSAWFVQVVYSTFFMCLIGRGGRAHSLLAKIMPSLNNTT